MIIKRYNGENFVELFPKTTTTRLFNSTGTTSVFDSNDKINPNFLPNSVFDSLYFFSNAIASSGSATDRAFDAIKNAFEIDRSPLGYYWVVTTAGDLTSSITSSFRTLYTRLFTTTENSAVVTTGNTEFLRPGMLITGSNITTGTTILSITNSTTFVMSTNAGSNLTGNFNFAYNIASLISGGEEDQVGATVTPVTLEVGDWFVITKITGNGSTTPFTVTFAVVNNTYEIMTGAASSLDGAPGLVPQPLAANRLQFLRGDGTWATAYTHPDHTGDVTSTADGATVIGTGKVVTSMIANDAVTFDKFQDSASAGLSVIGRGTNSTGAFAEIAAGTNGHVLRRSGTTLGFGTIASAGITDGAVVEAKIGAGAVTNGKIGAGAVGTDKISNGAVTFSKLPQSSDSVSIIGRSVNSVGTYGEITVADPNLVLVSSDQGAGVTSLGFGQVNAGGIADGAISNAKLANTTGFTLKGKKNAGDGAVANLAPEDVRAMSNLAPTLFGATLLDPDTSEPLNTPILKLTGMADGTEIPTGTIWYDTTVA